MDKESTFTTVEHGTSSADALIQVAHNQAIYFWPTIEHILREHHSSFQDFFEIDDLLESCINGSMQLWIVRNQDEPYFVCFTTVTVFPKCRVVSVSYACGRNAKDAIKLLPLIEAWAQELGARFVLIPGRPGWRRYALDMGYYELNGALTKKLKNKVVN